MNAASKPKKRLSREEQKAERATALMGAAWTLFCEKGYEQLSVDEIAEYAGLSRMPVYSLFGDKQGLFCSLWERQTTDLSDTLLANCVPGNPLEKNLRAVARLAAQGFASTEPRHGEALFFVVQTISLHRPDIAERINTVASGIVDDFTAMIRDSSLDAGQSLCGKPDEIAAYIIAIINGSSTVGLQSGKRWVRSKPLQELFVATAIKRG